MHATIKVLIILAMLIYWMVPGYGQTTWTVTDTADYESGEAAIAGTLRKAILDAIAGDKIVFDLPSSMADNGKYIFNLRRQLTISKTLEVDGSTQSGFDSSDPEPVVVLDWNGRNIGGGFTGAISITANADGSKVKFLQLQFSNYSGITLSSSSQDKIEDVELEGNVIVGHVANGSNINATGGGIRATGALNLLIKSNYIGIDYFGDGSGGKENGGSGIDFRSSSNSKIIGNVICNYSIDGIWLNGVCSDNLIKDNKIGVNAQGIANVFSDARGAIRIYGSSSTAKAIGNIIEGNEIVYDPTNFPGENEKNSGAVRITYGESTIISKNSIYCHGTSGSNRALIIAGIQKPVINKGDCNNLLGTAPANAEVELFQSVTCGGSPSGKTYLGTATADGNGDWNLAGEFMPDIKIVATATTADGTSEFSDAYRVFQCISISGAEEVLVNAGNQYSVREIVGSTYNWTLSGGGTIQGSADQAQVTIDWQNTPGTYTLTVTETNADGVTSDPVTINIAVQELDEFLGTDGLTISGPKRILETTPGITYTLSPTDANATWSINGQGAIVGSSTGSSVSVDFQRSGVATLQVTSDGITREYAVEVISFSQYSKNVNIIASQSALSTHTVDFKWEGIALQLGHQVAIHEPSLLNSQSFFDTTDILVVPTAIIEFDDTQINNLEAFVRCGGNLYIQTEHDHERYPMNKVLDTLMLRLKNDAALQWIDKFYGQVLPASVTTDVATTPNDVPVLNYFWYGEAIQTGEGIIPIVNYEGDKYLGFVFNDKDNPCLGQLIAITDQDGVNQGLYPAFMQNMLNKLTELPDLEKPQLSKSPIVAVNHFGGDGTELVKAEMMIGGGQKEIFISADGSNGQDKEEADLQWFDNQPVKWALAFDGSGKYELSICGCGTQETLTYYGSSIKPNSIEIKTRARQDAGKVAAGTIGRLNLSHINGKKVDQDSYTTATASDGNDVWNKVYLLNDALSSPSGFIAEGTMFFDWPGNDNPQDNNAGSRLLFQIETNYDPFLEGIAPMVQN